MVTHKEWVERQFNTFKAKKNKHKYRDILLISSFIEAVVRKKAKNDGEIFHPDFKVSLKRLGVEFHEKSESIKSYKRGCKYKANRLQEINNLRVRRNELLHDIIENDIHPTQIDNILIELCGNIEIICTNSKLIRGYFINNYGFDPKDKI